MPSLNHSDSDGDGDGLRAAPPSRRTSRNNSLANSQGSSDSEDAHFVIREADLLSNAQSILNPNPEKAGYVTAIKWFTRLGSYPMKACIRDLQAIVNPSRSGPAFIAQSAIHLLGTVGTGIAGGFLDGYWPSMSDSIYSMTETALGFLGDGMVEGGAYLANILIMAAIGAKVGDVVLSYLFNKILNSPHAQLHFSKSQIKKIAFNAGFNEDDREALKDIRDLIIVLQQLYKIKDQKFQGLARTRESQKLLKAAQGLREGDLRPLMKRLKETKARKSVAIETDDDGQRSKMIGTIAKQALTTAKRINAGQAV